MLTTFNNSSMTAMYQKHCAVVSVDRQGLDRNAWTSWKYEKVVKTGRDFRKLLCYLVGYKLPLVYCFGTIYLKSHYLYDVMLPTVQGSSIIQT
jgi:hypothetical protein